MTVNVNVGPRGNLGERGLVRLPGIGSVLCVSALGFFCTNYNNVDDPDLAIYHSLASDTQDRSGGVSVAPMVDERSAHLPMLDRPP